MMVTKDIFLNKATEMNRYQDWDQSDITSEISLMSYMWRWVDLTKVEAAIPIV